MAVPVCAICSIAMLTAVLSPCPGVCAVQPPHWLDCDRVPPPRAAPLRRPVRPGKTGMVIALASTGHVVKPKCMWQIQSTCGANSIVQEAVSGTRFVWTGCCLAFSPPYLVSKQIVRLLIRSPSQRSPPWISPHAIWWLAHQGPRRLPGLDSSACVTVLIVTVRESEQGFLAIHAVSRALLRTAPYCSGVCGAQPMAMVHLICEGT